MREFDPEDRVIAQTGTRTWQLGRVIGLPRMTKTGLLRPGLTKLYPVQTADGVIRDMPAARLRPLIYKDMLTPAPSLSKWRPHP